MKERVGKKILCEWHVCEMIKNHFKKNGRDG